MGNYRVEINDVSKYVPKINDIRGVYMKRFSRFLSILLTLSIISCIILASSASAASTFDFMAKIPGYTGNIAIWGGSDENYKGDKNTLYVRSSEDEDISGLQVTWSVEDPSIVSLKANGYSKDRNHFSADIDYLKGGVTAIVYATVNGIKLEEDIRVEKDYNGIDEVLDGFNRCKWCSDGTGYRSESSDTIGNFTVPYNSTYTFKITTNNGNMGCDYGTGNFTSFLQAGSTYCRMLRNPNGCGDMEYSNSSSSFKYISTTKYGNIYYIKFKAIGKVGDRSGFFLFDGNVPFAVATIVAA